jgi:Tol biopolymer transport system component
LNDGKTLLYLRQVDAFGNSIYSVPVSGGSKPVKLVAPASSQGTILNYSPSPDGRWIAYASNESGRFEVYLVPYPNVTAGKWQVSANGAQAPAWRADGKELYIFCSDNRVYGVAFDGSGSQPQIGGPQPLFAIPNTAFNVFYDAAPDGKRFLVNHIPEQTSTPVRLLINWPEALKK